MSQQQQVVSIYELTHTLKASALDTLKVSQLLKISEYYFFKNGRKTIDLDSSLSYANAAEALSVKLNYQKGIGNSYEQISKIYHFKNNAAKGKYYANKAIEIFKANNCYMELGFAYYDLSGYYSINNSTEIMERIRIVEQLALPAFKKTTIKLKEADILKELGDLLQLIGNYSKALSTLNYALQLYQSIHYPNLQGIYNLIGNIYSITGNNEQALKYGLLAINSAELVKDTTIQLATIFNRIGSSYHRMKKYNYAYEYLQKALTVAQKYKDTETIVLLTSNISRVLISMNKPHKALAILKEAQQKYPIEDIYLRLYITTSFLKAHLELKQYNESQKYCDQLLAISKNLSPNDPDLSEVQYPVTEFYLATQQYDLARKRLIITDAFYKAIKNPLELAQNQLLWFKLDSIQGKYLSAISHYQQYKVLGDSSLNEITRRHIEQLQIEFETEKKDKDLILKQQNIELLTKHGQLQQSQLQQERLTKNVVLAGTALLLIILVLIYKNSQHRLKTNKQLRLQQAEIEKKNSSLENLVKEKEWLVKEIHHRVKNNLQIVMSLMNIQSNYLENSAALEAIKESQSRMNSMLLIHQKLYQSDSFVSIGMNKYIHDLVNYLIESFGYNKKIDKIINVTNVELAISQAVPIGLILNEAVTNSIKYAFRKDDSKVIIKVSLQRKSDGQWKLVTADNGIGLPDDFNFKKPGTVGITLIETLTEQIGGKLHFNSEHGLEISITFAKSETI